MARERAETSVRTRGRRRLASAVGVGAVMALVGVLLAVVPNHGTGGDTARPARAAGSTTPKASRPSSMAGISPPAAYLQAVDVAAEAGLRVWLEADLAKRWLAGPSQFEAGVQRLGTLARRPGVVGFKVADEMGYDDGLSSSEQILGFLHDTADALHRVAPGKKILVDMIVPELGCLPGVVPEPLWASVLAAQERGRYPQLALGRVDQYVRSRTIDVLDISTGLRDDRTYAGWGTDRDTAQRLAWREVDHRGWSSFLTVQARKALAEAGGYDGSSRQAAADLRTWVDIPLQDGARAVDIWTWAQHYRGQTFALLGAELAPSPLWNGLLDRRAGGGVFFTHFTPSLTRQSVTVDLARLSAVFTDVFVATGTG